MLYFVRVARMREKAPGTEVRVSARRRRGERSPHRQGGNEEALPLAVTLSASGVTGKPALTLDRLGGLPQGNGTCTHDPGPDVGEIRYGVPAGILVTQ